MADKVIIRQKGFYRVDWIGELRRNVISKIKKEKILSCLRCEVEVEESVTLADVMKLVRDNKNLTKFISQYSWCKSIDKFHERLDLKPKIDENDDIDYLEVYQCFFLNTYEDKTFVDKGCAFHGVGRKIIESLNRPEHYSMSLTDLEDMMALQVKINENFQIFKDHEIICECKQPITFLEFLDAIYWDISFHGGPEENEAVKEDLNERLESIKNGTEELIPMDETMDRLKEHMENNPPKPPLEIEDGNLEDYL